MKKLIIFWIFIVFSFALFACKEEEPVIEPTPTEDWKILYDIEPTSPDFLEHVTSCYQIFPYAFADSNGDGIGDLNGITENLDYLTDILGVDCIWINPIHPSPTYHKYDVTDYYAIDRTFGTMRDFENLIAEADSRNLRVLMDLVINHTSSQHPWFINASIGPAASYRDFYVWNTLEDRTKFPDKTGWYLKNGVYYFASFWSEMPELNYNNPLVREEIKNILTFWLEKGVDGFRIDAAKHIYDTKEYPVGTATLSENVNYFREFNHFVKTLNPNAFVVGEVYTIGSDYVSNFYRGMDSAFNFEFADTLIQGLQSNQANNLANVMIKAQTNFLDKKALPLDSLFLTNHDQNRLADQVGFNPNKMKLAAQVLMMIPGISWIYYGEELGMAGAKPDNNIRQPYKWGNERIDYTVTGGSAIGSWQTYNTALLGMTEQLLDPTSLLNRYIELIALRKDHPLLARGQIKAITSPRSDILMYLMVQGEQAYLVMHNFSTSEVTMNHTLSSYNLVYQTHENLLSATSITMNPYSSMVISVPVSTTTFN